jgi:hypothetical protein
MEEGKMKKARFVFSFAKRAFGFSGSVSAGWHG